MLHIVVCCLKIVGCTIVHNHPSQKNKVFAIHSLLLEKFVFAMLPTGSVKLVRVKLVEH